MAQAACSYIKINLLKNLFRKILKITLYFASIPVDVAAKTIVLLF